MSALKFRAWDIENNKWLCTSYLECIDSIENTASLKSIIHHKPPHEDLVVIQQFTGLLDKHNKEIYEGDIVKFTSFGVDSGTNDYLQLNNRIKKIAWGLNFGDYPTASFVAINLNPADLETGVALNVMMQPYMEVVGDIFENPELLK